MIESRGRCDAQSEIGDRRDLGHRATDWARSPTGLLALVALGYWITQFVLFDETRYLEWDEAVYIGKASDRFQLTTWSSHRALGVPWLLKPAFAISASFAWMRWYLTFTSTIALWLAFAAWLKTVRYGASIAMALFSSSWLALFYGSEASPNLYVAACAVGSAGWSIRYLESRFNRYLVPMALGIALATLFRPSDGAMLGFGLASIGLLASTGRQRWITGAVAGASFCVGLVPWAIDAWMNFGDPFTRWRAASKIVSGSLGWRVGDHVRLLNGPLTGPDQRPGIPLGALAILVTVIAIAGVGMADRRARGPTSFVIGLSVLMASPYVFYVGTQAPRFLLPTYGLLAIGAAIGLAELMRNWRLIGVLVVGALTVFGLLSVQKAITIEDEQRLRRSEAIEIAEIIDEMSGAGTCIVLSQYGYPQLTIATGCHGDRLFVGTATCQVAALTEATDVLIVALVGSLPAELAAAQIGDPVPGPGSWVTARLDPARVACQE